MLTCRSTDLNFNIVSTRGGLIIQIQNVEKFGQNVISILPEHRIISIIFLHVQTPILSPSCCWISSPCFRGQLFITRLVKPREINSWSLKEHEEKIQTNQKMYRENPQIYYLISMEKSKQIKKCIGKSKQIKKSIRITTTNQKMFRK